MPNMITLDYDTESIQYLCKKDKRLAKIISTIGSITYQLYSDSYSFLIHEIIEQMLSVKAGAKIYGCLEELCDGNITVATVKQLSDEQIRGIGTASSKVKYIHGLTNAVEWGDLDFKKQEAMIDDEVIKRINISAWYWNLDCENVFNFCPKSARRIAL